MTVRGFGPRRQKHVRLGRDPRALGMRLFHDRSSFAATQHMPPGLGRKNGIPSGETLKAALADLGIALEIPSKFIKYLSRFVAILQQS